MKKTTHYSRGFTLIELMVVLVIIGVLAALIVPNVLNRADDAKVTAARTDVNNLMTQLKLYKLDNQRYPNQEQGLNALVQRPTTGPNAPNWRNYIDKLPKDPKAEYMKIKMTKKELKEVIREQIKSLTK